MGMEGEGSVRREENERSFYFAEIAINPTRQQPPNHMVFLDPRA